MKEQPFETKFLHIPKKHTISNAWLTGDKRCLLLTDGRYLSGQVFLNEPEHIVHLKNNALTRLDLLINDTFYTKKLTINKCHVLLNFKDPFMALRPWVNHVGWMINEITRLAQLITWCQNDNETMLVHPPIATYERQKLSNSHGLSAKVSRSITPIGLALILQSAGFFENRAWSTHADFFTMNMDRVIGVPYWRVDNRRYEKTVDEILEALSEHLGDQQSYLQRLAFDLDPVPFSQGQQV